MVFSRTENNILRAFTGIRLNQEQLTLLLKRNISSEEYKSYSRRKTQEEINIIKHNRAKKTIEEPNLNKFLKTSTQRVLNN